MNRLQNQVSISTQSDGLNEITKIEKESATTSLMSQMQTVSSFVPENMTVMDKLGILADAAKYVVHTIVLGTPDTQKPLISQGF